MLGYIGSKKSLLNFIEESLKDVVTSETVFADLFAGTGAVSQHFKETAKHVVVNDSEYYSYVINYSMLKTNFSEKLKTIVGRLNNLEGIEGLITKHYAQDRMFFTEANAKRIDAIRQEIDKLKDIGEVDISEYNFLIASLLVATDKVANTASVYGAYLKAYKKTALKDLMMKPIHTCISNENKDHEVYNGDTLDVIVDKTFDVVYIDPPYNSRQYSANYGLLNYLAKYDDSIEITGKGGLIKNYFKSSFCKKGEVKESFDKLIQNTNAKYIFVSYNNEGLLSKDEMTEIFEKYGETTVSIKEYKKFLSQKDEKHKEIKIVQEYLYKICKN